MPFHESCSPLRYWHPDDIRLGASYGPGHRGATPRNGYQPVEAARCRDDGAMLERDSIVGRLEETAAGVAAATARHARPRSVAETDTVEGSNHRKPARSSGCIRAPTACFADEVSGIFRAGAEQLSAATCF